MGLVYIEYISRLPGIDLDGVNDPIRLAAAGTYADFGREIL